MDIPTQDISRNSGYGDLIFRKIKISEIEKAPTSMTDEGALLIVSIYRYIGKPCDCTSAPL